MGESLNEGNPTKPHSPPVEGSSNNAGAPKPSHSGSRSRSGRSEPSKVATGTTARGAQAELAEKASRAHAQRIVRLAPLPLIGWLASMFIDVAFGKLVYPGHERFVMFLRIGVLAALLPVTLLVRRYGSKNPNALDAIIGAMVAMLAGALAIIGAVSGGFQSIHGAGVIIVMTVPSFLELPAKRGVLVSFCGIAAFIAGALLTHVFIDEPERSLTIPLNRIGFMGQIFLMTLMASLAVMGGHWSHKLRLQVYESRSIGRYKLKRLLGRGGMGEVWAAWHEGLKRDVALKILRDAGERTQKRFEREVRVLADLKHPNTVRIFEYGVSDDGLLYYAMELLEGVDLGALVRREGALPEARVVYLIEHAARALAEAHQKGIVHRDVKPENLFVASAGGEADFVKVLDFGIVRFEAEGEETLTQEGQFAGTPSFMAPEVSGGAEATPRSDVYAMGAVLYFLLTSTPVFQVKGTAAVLKAHREEPVMPPSLRMSSPLDPALEAIVLRCLSKTPEARPKDADELAKLLEQTGLAASWRPRADTTQKDAPRELERDQVTRETSAEDPTRENPTREEKVDRA